jgi:predicted double-glycine peptidase
MPVSISRVLLAFINDKNADDLSDGDKKVVKKKPVKKVTDDADVFLEVPVIRQSTDYSCGAASFLAILGYYGFDPYEKQIITAMGTTLAGTDPKGFPKAAKKFDLKADVKEHMTIDEVKERLDKKIPVILDIQAWGDKKDYTDEWDDGHYVVAIGYDKEGFYLMDPSQIGYSYVSSEELKKRWHDILIDNKTKFFDMGIAVSGKEPKFKYNAVKTIE